MVSQLVSSTNVPQFYLECASIISAGFNLSRNLAQQDLIPPCHNEKKRKQSLEQLFFCIPEFHSLQIKHCIGVTIK